MNYNIRILSDNAADRATVTSSSTIAAGLPLSNLKTNLRGQVCRSLTNSLDLTLEWSELESVGVVVLPLTSLLASSTIRVKAFLNTADTVPLVDTGVVYAAPGAVLENWDFSQPLNVNAFSDTDLPTVVCFLGELVACKKVTIEIVDPDASFIDVSRLVVGPYVELKYGASYGAASSLIDLTKNTRAESGDSISDWGPKARSLSFDLEWISEPDRAKVRQILFKGIGKNLFVSLITNSDDPVLVRDYSIYGKQAQAGSMSFAFYQNHSTKITIESF